MITLHKNTRIYHIRNTDLFTESKERALNIAKKIERDDHFIKIQCVTLFSLTKLKLLKYSDSPVSYIGKNVIFEDGEISINADVKVRKPTLLTCSFENNKYLVVRGLLSEKICKIAEQYCLFQLLNNFKPEKGEFSQVPGTHSVHADSLMESLLLQENKNKIL